MNKLDRGSQWLSIIIITVMSYVLTFILGSNVPISGMGIVVVILGTPIFAGAAPTILLHFIFKFEVTRKDASECAFVVASLWGVVAAFSALHIMPIAILGLPIVICIAWSSSQLTCILIAKARTNAGEVHG